MFITRVRQECQCCKRGWDAAHLRGDDRQRTTRRARLKAEVQHALTGRQPLPCCCLQQLQLEVIVGRADVLDVA